MDYNYTRRVEKDGTHFFAIFIISDHCSSAAEPTALKLSLGIYIQKSAHQSRQADSVSVIEIHYRHQKVHYTKNAWRPITSSQAQQKLNKNLNDSNQLKCFLFDFEYFILIIFHLTANEHINDLICGICIERNIRTTPNVPVNDSVF